MEEKGRERKKEEKEERER
jgi:hypothetical protein